MSFRHHRMNKRIWEIVRRRVLELDRYTCQSCYRRGGRFHVDHIVPLSKGGELYDPANLQTLCIRCHSEKTAKENAREATSPDEAAWDSWLNHQPIGER